MVGGGVSVPMARGKLCAEGTEMNEALSLL